MENKYYPTVSLANVKEIIEVMDVSKDYIIQIDDEDIHHTLVDADNAVLIKGSTSGDEKVKKALSEIDLHSRSLVAEKLYTAKRILIYIESDPKVDIKVDEMNAISDFVTKFNPDIDVIWGVSRRSLDGSKTIEIKLLAADLE